MTVGNLTDRLRTVVRGTGTPSQPAISFPPRDDVESVLQGAWESTQDSRSFVVERRSSPDVCHGGTRVGVLAESLLRAVQDAPLLASGAAARLPFVFFDLETTGLSGGAGTYAFLVGCGWFDEAGSFVTRQHVLVRTVDEGPMLRAVAAELDKAGALVSFNGKSFDAPLLESRFLYHRLPWMGGRLPHVDVLHPARRFWKSDGSGFDDGSCSLGSLERHVLGADRSGDVAGFEAPARYFRFIRTGDPRPLVGVLEHNRLDMLSLAALTVRLLRLVNDGPAEARDGREALAVGRIYDRAGLPARAADAYCHALTLVGGSAPSARTSIRIDALRGLAHLARRGRRYDEAAARWREVLELPGCPGIVAREAAEALAIHHEHRVRDLRSARDFALKTFEGSERPARANAVRHRLARLDRKIEAAASAAPRLQLED